MAAPLCLPVEQRPIEQGGSIPAVVMQVRLLKSKVLAIMLLEWQPRKKSGWQHSPKGEQSCPKGEQNIVQGWNESSSIKKLTWGGWGSTSEAG